MDIIDPKEAEEKLSKQLQDKSSKLTRKQSLFVAKLLSNPKISATQAALETYNTTSRNVAKNIASENMAKPNVMAVLRKHSVDAEGVLIELMHGAENENVRLGAAKDVLDRVHGKATQKTEVKSELVRVNIDLTGGA